MIYVLDTCVFRKMLDHLPRKGSVFQNVWDSLEAAFQARVIISVDEVFEEVSGHFASSNGNLIWLESHKYVFEAPSNAESQIIQKIFTDVKMRESIHVKNILANRPSADVYIVAKAKVVGATVVSVESYKPNSAQIPNMCEFMGVPCICYDDFMAAIMNRAE